MVKFEKMILWQFPYAIPNKDFTLKTGIDGNVELDYWNEEKLGQKPNIIQIHTAYMQMAKKKKELLPKFDDSDPAPWLNQKAETSRRSAEEKRPFFHIPLVDVDLKTGIVTQKQ